MNVNINLTEVTMDLTNVVCVETEQCLFPMKKPPKEDKDLVSAASNGGFPRYPKCKVFASFLSIREKDDKANTSFSNFFFKAPIR